MKSFGLILLSLAAAGFFSCSAQENGSQSLSLRKQISMPNVKGRIDHIDIDVKKQIVYIAALGNNTLEVADLKSGRVTGHIQGLKEPQGVAFISKHDEIMVANGGDGECVFYDALTLKKTGSVKLEGDADDVRYDSEADKIYVGYGDGGIAIIDAVSRKQTGNIALSAHPESFQLDTKSKQLWVNLPGSGSIAVCNLKTLKQSANWTRLLPRSNFPMAYDAAQQRIIVGYRIPAKLVIYDSRSGKELFAAGMVSDVDDLYWDQKNKQVLITGGGGAVDIFKQISNISYKKTAHIETRSGARTSLFVPELGLFLIAARESGDKKAALLVYHIDP